MTADARWRSCRSSPTRSLGTSAPAVGRSKDRRAVDDADLVPAAIAEESLESRKMHWCVVVRVPLVGGRQVDDQGRRRVSKVGEEVVGRAGDGILGPYSARWPST